MRCEYRQLGDVAIQFIDGDRGKNYPSSNEFSNVGYCLFLNAKNVTPDGFSFGEVSFISQEKDAMLRKGKLEKNDVVLTTRGTVGNVAFYGERVLYSNARINSGMLIIRPDPSVFFPEYVYWLFRSDIIQNQIKRFCSGMAQPQLPISSIRKFEIPLVNIKTQKKIAAILSALDEKIATNRAINDNLADLLQTIYQERFGNDILAVNQGVLSDICSYSRDKVAVSELNVRTYFSTENMLSGKAGSTEATSLPTTSQTTACHKGDTLISNIRPYFKKIVYCEDKCGCSTDVLCFTPSQPRYSTYLFSTLYADKFFAFMVAGSKGTKMPRGDKQQIMTYPIVLPSEEELARFNTIALPLIDQIYSYRAENKRLSLLRDTLLTKLMSGEIDVSDIQL